ncbi:MAG TPA: hypothetical protein VHV52_12690 [Gaiellaceae bacterium]|jgi:hypothetical protein|nr:hypothetical protein [Gaiellaceae bacterium]
MTLTTLIIVNTVLAGLLIYGIVRLLHHGIHLDRHARHEHLAKVATLPRHEREKIAA